MLEKSSRSEFLAVPKILAAGTETRDTSEGSRPRFSPGGGLARGSSSASAWPTGPRTRVPAKARQGAADAAGRGIEHGAEHPLAAASLPARFCAKLKVLQEITAPG